MKVLLRCTLILTLLLFIPALAAAENPAPTVAITSPEQGVTIASVSVPVTITYAAPEEALIAGVELIVGGAVVARRDLDPPQASGECVLTWPASRYRNGEHTLTARAVDEEGRSADTSISVVLRRRLLDRSPRPRIISPKAGETVSGVTTVRVAAENPARMQYVIFLVDDAFKALTNVRPFTYRWDTSRYLNGLHQLQVKAYSSRGDGFPSPAIEVIVDNPGGATSVSESPAISTSGPAPEPTAPPARTSVVTIPAPRESGILPPLTSPPFISPPADLMRPPGPATTRPASPPAAEPRPVADEAPEPIAPAAPEPVEAVPAPDVAPASEPEPLTIAMLPEADPAPSVPVTPEPPAPAAEVVEVEPVIEPAAIEVALLPPASRPVAPPPRVAPEPADLAPVHVVQSGDHVWGIAAQYGVSARAVVAANHLSDPSVIHVGQRLRIPTSPVYFDGRPLATDVPPVIADGRALVSLRTIVEKVGGTVGWDSGARSARAVAGGREIVVTLGSDLARVDGSPVKMDLAASLRSGRTMVPLRFLGEVFRLALSYEQGVIQIASGR